MTDDKALTHTAFTLRREGKRRGRWLEIGNARQDDNGIIHVFLDRLPIGGFSGYVYMCPLGSKPPGAEGQHPLHLGEDV